MSKIYVKVEANGYVTILNERGQPTGAHLVGTGWHNIQINGDTIMATSSTNRTYLFDRNGNIIRCV